MWNGKMIVDNFAGGGGASTGIEMALGVSPDIAINHDAQALAMHAANHPRTRHIQNNVWQIDPDEVCERKPVALCWFSPDCKHFSKAKGGKPVEKRIRDLAWVVVRWARAHKSAPEVIGLENVEEFAQWGPLTIDGMPDPEKLGLTFKRFVRVLKGHGYHDIDWQELRAADYGAPTIRKRFFMIARRDGRGVFWPRPTHAKGGAGGLKPWRGAHEVIDFTAPCPSIFLTREQGRSIGVNRPLAPATMARIARGVQRFVLNNPRPFLVSLTHQGGVDRVEDTGEPMRTVTGATRGEKALAVPYLAPYLAGCGGRAAQSPPKSASEPLNTITAKADQIFCAPLLVPRYGEHAAQLPRSRAIGEPLPAVVPTANGASLVAAFLAQHNTDMVGHPATAPVSTIVGKGCTQAVIAAHLAQHNSDTGAARPGRDIADPLATVTATGHQSSLVTSHLVKLRGTCRDGQALESPMPTVTAGGWHIGEVRAFLQSHLGAEPIVWFDGVPWSIVDIGMRMLKPRELFGAQSFPDTYILEAPFEGGHLNKTAQIRMCGNSVPPVLARELIRANMLGDDAEREAA